MARQRSRPTVNQVVEDLAASSDATIAGLVDALWNGDAEGAKSVYRSLGELEPDRLVVAAIRITQVVPLLRRAIADGGDLVEREQDLDTAIAALRRYPPKTVDEAEQIGARIRDLERERQQARIAHGAAQAASHRIGSLAAMFPRLLADPRAEKSASESEAVDAEELAQMAHHAANIGFVTEIRDGIMHTAEQPARQKKIVIRAAGANAVGAGKE